MTQYNGANIVIRPSTNRNKISNKTETGVTLKLSLNMTGNSNNETNFPRRFN